MARELDLKLGATEIERMGPRAVAIVGLALYSAAIRGVGIIQSQIIPKKVPQPSDRSLYRAGWRASPLSEGAAILGGEIFNVEPHAVFIERGVRAENVKAGRAMLRALAEWAARKRLDGADTPEGAARIAFAIAQSMKRRGIFNRGKGLHVLGDLMKHHMPKIVREEVRRAALKRK